MPHPIITSRQNQRVKDAAKLRDRRGREKQRRILIDGVREIGQAEAACIAIEEVFFCETRLASAEGKELVVRSADAGVEVSNVSPEVFDKLAYGSRSDGIIAVAQTPERPLDALTLSSSPLIALLDQVEKPGNIGAIARSADAAGIAGMVLVDGRTDLFNPNAIRASVGALFAVPIAEASVRETMDWLRARQMPLYIATAEATTLYTAVDWTAGGVVVFGSEADGVSTEWQNAGATPIHLPMLGTADSLNVSVTAAVVFYEALRQRELNADSE